MAADTGKSPPQPKHETVKGAVIDAGRSAKEMFTHPLRTAKKATIGIIESLASFKFAGYAWKVVEHALGKDEVKQAAASWLIGSSNDDEYVMVFLRFVRGRGKLSEHELDKIGLWYRALPVWHRRNLRRIIVDATERARMEIGASPADAKLGERIEWLEAADKRQSTAIRHLVDAFKLVAAEYDLTSMNNRAIELNLIRKDDEAVKNGMERAKDLISGATKFVQTQGQAYANGARQRNIARAQAQAAANARHGRWANSRLNPRNWRPFWMLISR